MIFPVTETKPSISSTIPIGTNGSSSKFFFAKLRRRRNTLN